VAFDLFTSAFIFSHLGRNPDRRYNLKIVADNPARDHPTTKRSLLPDAVEHYVAQVATKETNIQQRLRSGTEKLPNAGGSHA
jgi:hypothetical protein